MIGPGSLHGQPAHKTLIALHGHSRVVIAQENITHPWGDAAVDDCCDILLLGERVELERVLSEERDVYDVLPTLDDGFEGLKPQKSRHGSDHKIAICNELFDSLRLERDQR
jgi:hypothetical protein